MSTEPVGLARDLARQRVMRAQVLGEDVAVWRSASGKLAAWANRCPHRGMRLSYGFVRGESLACAYHGWHYNCAGKCHYVPAHPDLEPPATIKTKIYGVKEQDHVLWVNTQGDAKPPTLPCNLTGLRSITLACDHARAYAAFTSTSPPTSATDKLPVNAFPDRAGTLVFGSISIPYILTLLQQVASNTISCHILVNNESSAEDRIALSRWCESVRREAENSHVQLPMEDAGAV